MAMTANPMPMPNFTAPEQHLPQMGCTGNSFTIPTEAVAQSLDSRSPDRSSPCHRENTAAIAGWRTHHAGRFESAEEWVSDKAVSF
jgi:hypothetical protein